VTVATADDVSTQILATGDPLRRPRHLKSCCGCGARQRKEQIRERADHSEYDDGQEKEKGTDDPSEHAGIVPEATCPSRTKSVVTHRQPKG
jgi:hypothetical protein